LKQLAAAVPPDPAVPSHGSFRPSQVLIDHDQIGFIDFDSFCQSEPANDLALFLSTLMVNSLTGSDSGEDEEDGTAAQVDASGEAAKPVAETREARFALATSLHEKFLNAYEQHHAVSRQRVALWESLDLLLLVLHYWIKVKPSALKEIFYLLEQFLQSMHFVRKT
jgi:Ser/Thr protein kinase RdoA (MazF antagonist)